MVIGTNVASLTAQRHLASSQNDLNTAMERLSSGNRINSAMDDAAGLAITHRLDSKITGLDQSVRNANDGISMLQVAEGALEEVTSMLTRMKELAVQAKNDSYSTTDRTALNTEFQALSSEINRISTKTDFNGTSLLGANATKVFQVGDAADDTISISLKNVGNTEIGSGSASSGTKQVQTYSLGAAITAAAGDKLEFTGAWTGAVKREATFSHADQTEASVLTALRDNILANDSAHVESITISDRTMVLTYKTASDTQIGAGALNQSDNGVMTASTVAATTAGVSASGMAAASTGLDNALISGADNTNANTAIGIIDDALNDISTYRSDLGAVSNRLEHTINNLMSRSEHQSAARSRIEDTDFATESANLAKAQVLQQAGTAMLAQANASTQSVLSLLK
jgi:flagellin